MPFRLLRSSLFILIFGLTVASCGYIPRQVAGLPSGPPWDALPLRKWLAEDRAEPIALAFCAPPECSPGLAVSVIRLTGKDADITDAVLRDPERLARALRSPVGREKPVKTRISVERLVDSPYPGFAIELAPSDGGKRPAYGAALGRRSGNDLEVVLVIGEAPDAVRERAREVAARELGS
ncbi:hypothetical protein [Microvirga lotononidis]|uniref:Lipoprotein n=1 Tax=Microvirga lotononidis TaxID=864069 RepID=I4YTH2_9HYPH|nr:hypothetical protein [Microvirga lotononidis]EIM27264.1 hypothetical protein MicloDRAFT_00038220 [Microvirga lotononidis]WQO28564.1 hypothetical protein U0023_05655 [Microvirga lotononidis]